MVETSSVPNGNEAFANLLRTRKCFTTSHIHIYSIPPMSRMNYRQNRVPKLLCYDFIRVFSLTVETTFWKRQPVTELSELKHCFKIKISNRRKIIVNKFELGQSTRGWKIIRVLQFAVVVQAHRMFWSISEANVSTFIQFFNFYFTKSMTVIIPF